jgi:hypothetical protein
MTKLRRRTVLRNIRQARIYDSGSFENQDFSGMDLDGVDFSELDLTGANFSGADLSFADFSEANLSKANLSKAILRGANFNGAQLDDTDFTEADLSWADLRDVLLNGPADFSGTDLTYATFSSPFDSQANFSRARMWNTVFTDFDFRMVSGLDTVEHLGPSTIGIDTIYRSKGKIPEVFLRGIGVPDTFITYAASLTDEAIQYYSCFISYSSKDEAFAQRLHADLQQKGVRCWFAPEDMKIGDKIRPTIDQSIRIHDKLLIILSENSLNSAWVESEVEKAFEEERKRKQTVLFPVRLDEAVMETEESWAAEIRRTRHIGDFSRWKEHDAYQQAFERLLRDLKAVE